MKYTDRFFKFPVRIYDRFTAEKAEKLEKEREIPIEGDWAAGMARIPHEQIISWSDYFDSTQGLAGVKEEGFKFTLVITTEGPYISVWERKEFEKKLDEYAERYEKETEKDVKTLYEKLNHLVDKTENTQLL